LKTSFRRAQAVISKPFDPMTLAYVVGNHLDALKQAGSRARSAIRRGTQWYCPPIAAILLIGVSALSGVAVEPPHEPQLNGFNVIAAPGHPFGSASARLALANARQLGARAIAVVPFLWQASPARPDLVRGKDMTDEELRTAIRDAHALGLAVLVKPHVWVPERWAGSVAMNSEDDWRKWFANYQRELERIAHVAAEEKAEALAIGTELEQASQRPEWNEVIAAARRVYSGRLLYVAHNVEEAERVPFWDRLDAIGVTLYPPLGTDEDRDGQRSIMRTIADRLDVLAARTGKRIIVGEIGLRSAQGAAARPWESAEERVSAPDPALQAEVLADWLAILDRPTIEGVVIWRWFTDPDAGGLGDTDFTVQHKPAERVLMCAWTGQCDQAEDRP
jgi:hypothetical protein